MQAQRTVALYGVSVFMAAVEAALNTAPGFHVMRVNASLADAEQRLDGICPDIVIVDLADTHANFPISFLLRHPDLPVIGLDLTNHKVVVLACEYPAVTTLDELVRLIHSQMPALGDNNCV